MTASVNMVASANMVGYRKQDLNVSFDLHEDLTKPSYYRIPIFLSRPELSKIR